MTFLDRFNTSVAQKLTIIEKSKALEGRAKPLEVGEPHYVFKRPLTFGTQVGLTSVTMGLGCFWGAEKRFWGLHGVYLTAVGYGGGFTPNPTYEEVCSGKTGHTEVVRVEFDPAIISLAEVLQCFWESHDPTQGMRQGNDVGTQYRSGIYLTSEVHKGVALSSRDRYQQALHDAGFGEITTEILNTQGGDKANFYFAEDYHQQYLAKNPQGYCGLGGTGVTVAT